MKRAVLRYEHQEEYGSPDNTNYGEVEMLVIAFCLRRMLSAKIKNFTQTVNLKLTLVRFQSSPDNRVNIPPRGDYWKQKILAKKLTNVH